MVIHAYMVLMMSRLSIVIVPTTAFIEAKESMHSLTYTPALFGHHMHTRLSARTI